PDGVTARTVVKTDRPVLRALCRSRIAFAGQFRQIAIALACQASNIFPSIGIPFQPWHMVPLALGVILDTPIDLDISVQNVGQDRIQIVPRLLLEIKSLPRPI